MNPFLTQLADLCRAERIRAKWVVVPSHALERTLGERLALAGTGWANVRLISPISGEPCQATAVARQPREVLWVRG